MTTEIAVMNKMAIALAADSAVTIDSRTPNGASRKVYNSANKLFTLSRNHPVGIMIYNSMELCGVPWETIVKEYRAKISDKSFETINDYASNFFEYIEAHPEMFPQKNQLTDLFHRCKNYIMNVAECSKSAEEFRTKIKEDIKALEKFEMCKNLENIQPEKFNACLDPVSAATIKLLPVSYSKGSIRKIKRLFLLYLTRENVFTNYSGVVISGFGSKEMHPNLIEFHVEHIISGKLNYCRVQDSSISMHNPACIIPFAQQHVIETITKGIAPSYKDKMIKEINALSLEIPNSLFEIFEERKGIIDKRYKQLASDAAQNAVQKMLEKLDQGASREYSEPIVHAISVMPISELAVVAETFVNLTQIHQRMSLETETVGGPIDVAVISKGDGFVWIKRKHYFDPRLNPAFTARY